MWLLTHEGDAFEGKAHLLKPGKKYLIGRTEVDFVIANKTVSRKHVEIRVEEFELSKCADPRLRSRVVVTDISAKGCQVNGETLKGTSVDLTQDENDLVVGKARVGAPREDWVFGSMKITWFPCNFAFTFTSKEQKADPFTALYQTLGPLDIKVLADFEAGVTTHVLSRKRNTAKVLRALIGGVPVVEQASWIGAVVAAATSDSEGKSPLERDFHPNFPNPCDFLPPQGKEVQKEATIYQPDGRRKTMFEGYTFVFMNQNQYGNLVTPIEEAGGMALVRPVDPRTSTVEEFVDYVKNVAGEKGLGEFEDGSEGKGVVVVKYAVDSGEYVDWYNDFTSRVALDLDQRMLLQSEFLEVILDADASRLRKSLEEFPPTSRTDATSQTVQNSLPPPRSLPHQSSMPQAPPSSSPHAPTPIEAFQSSIPAITQTQPRRGRRAPIKSTFKGFADSDSEEESQGSVVQQPTDPAAESQSQGLFVSQIDRTRELFGSQQSSQGLFVRDDDPPDVPSHMKSQPIVSSSRKRAIPPSDDEDENEDAMETFAPAAAALKRRKLADDSARRDRGEATPPPLRSPSTVKEEKSVVKSTVKKGVKRQDSEILTAARQEREKLEAELKAKRDEEREAIEEELDFVDAQALIVIEEVKLRTDLPIRSKAYGDQGDRWDDNWNGRKNFKKFRRRGVGDEPFRRPNKVIVPLEEVKNKEFGIGDDYWLEDNSPQKKKGKSKGKDSQRATQSQARSAARQAREPSTVAEEEEDEETIRESEDDSDPEITAPPTRARAAEKTQTNKRLASHPPGRAPPAKKARPLPKAREEPDEDVDEDEDSDDGNRFRFR